MIYKIQSNTINVNYLGTLSKSWHRFLFLLKPISFYITNLYQRDKLHIFGASLMPFFTSMALGFLLSSAVSFFNYCFFGSSNIEIALLFLLIFLISWSADVVKEGTYEHAHTNLMQKAFRCGIICFILSEVMFFFSFFWSFFHFSLSPSVFLFGVWPPLGIDTINPWSVPFLNTIILVSSGISLTVSHRAFFTKNWYFVNNYLIYTIFLGVIFTLCQLMEYMECPFSINDSTYGSIFFMSTGFHGLHVIVGSVLLFIGLLRAYRRDFTSNQHVGFELAAWYWHFVDIVWLFLFTAVYWWGS